MENVSYMAVYTCPTNPTQCWICRMGIQASSVVQMAALKMISCSTYHHRRGNMAFHSIKDSSQNKLESTEVLGFFPSNLGY